MTSRFATGNMGAALVEATESLKEEITIWSEGTRLAADLFIPGRPSDDGARLVCCLPLI